jgi:hypothetical protein
MRIRRSWHIRAYRSPGSARPGWKGSGLWNRRLRRSLLEGLVGDDDIQGSIQDRINSVIAVRSLDALNVIRTPRSMRLDGGDAEAQREHAAPSVRRGEYGQGRPQDAQVPHRPRDQQLTIELQFIAANAQHSALTPHQD